MTTETKRLNMVHGQLMPNGIAREAVLNAFLKVPREYFVDQTFKDSAYQDKSLILNKNRLFLSPILHGKLLQETTLEGKRVLVIESPYLAALCQQIAGHVTLLTADTSHRANRTLLDANITEVAVIHPTKLDSQTRFDVIFYPDILGDTPDSWQNYLTPNGTFLTLEQNNAANLIEAVRYQKSGHRHCFFDTTLPPQKSQEFTF